MDSRNSRKTTRQAIREIANEVSPAIEEHLLQLGAAQLQESGENSRTCAILCVEPEIPESSKKKPIYLTKIHDR